MNFFNWRYVYFVWTLEYPIEKPPVPNKSIDSIFNYGEIIQSIVTYAAGVYS